MFNQLELDFILRIYPNSEIMIYYLFLIEIIFMFLNKNLEVIGRRIAEKVIHLYVSDRNITYPKINFSTYKSS